MVYLDNAATTRLHPKVLDAMMPFMTEEFGNAGATYSFGISARQAVDKARKQVADFIGADSPEQIIFTSGGTESNNWVAYNTALIRRRRRGVVTSAVEHDSVMRSTGFLEDEYGFNVVRSGVGKDGRVLLEDAERNITKSTSLVSVMYVNNEVGAINDVESIGRMCKRTGSRFHCDAVQAPGCVEIDVNKIQCDFLSLSAHKLHGPKGVGALYVRDKAHSLAPMIWGGHEQEFGFRGGTENVAGIVGFGRACELVPRNLNRAVDHVSYKEIKKAFYTRLIGSLMGQTSEKRVEFSVNADSLESDGKVLSLRFKDVDAETLVVVAGTLGLCISAGSACRSRNQEPSHVLKAIGLTDNAARESVRISFSELSTLNEAREGAGLLAKALSAYRLV